MPAPDFETLYQFDENMNESFAALLEAASITPPKRGDKEDLVTPYAFPDFVTGAAREHWHKMADGSQRPDSFNARLAVSFVINRGVEAQDGKLALWKATIRKLFYDIKTNFVAANFPYYQIARIMEVGTSPTIDAGNDLDIAGMEWDIIFGIRTDAWPE